MEKVILFLLAPSLPFASAGDGQVREAMNIGAATIWLGMPEAQATTAIKSANYAQDDDGLVLSPSGVLGQVVVLNGRVSRLTKEWLLNSTENSHVGFASAFYGAVKSMTGGAVTSCRVSNRPPDEDVVAITCQMGAAVKQVSIVDIGAKAHITEYMETLDQSNIENRR